MEHTLLVLGLLKLQKMHGYQLSDLIDRRLKYLTDLKKPTLYHLLAKLEKQGEVTKSVSREGNRPERYTYRLTRRGEEHFQTLLRQNLKDTHATYFQDDIGLLFLNELPAADAHADLERKREGLDERIAWLKETLAQHRQDTPAYHTLRHHQIHLQAERAWLSELLERLHERPVRQDILKCLAATEPAAAKSNQKPRRSSSS